MGFLTHFVKLTDILITTIRFNQFNQIISYVIWACKFFSNCTAVAQIR